MLKTYRSIFNHAARIFRSVILERVLEELIEGHFVLALSKKS
jgi:hypothetical protein